MLKEEEEAETKTELCFDVIESRSEIRESSEVTSGDEPPTQRFRF